MLHVHDLGAGARGVMLLLISAAVPTVLLAPLAGSLADRVDSRLLLVSVLARCRSWSAWRWPSPRRCGAVYLLVMALQAGQAVVEPDLAGARARASSARPRSARPWAPPRRWPRWRPSPAPPSAGCSAGIGGQRLPLLVDAVSFLVLVVAALLVRTRRAGRRDRRAATPPTGPRAGRPAGRSAPTGCSGRSSSRCSPTSWSARRPTSSRSSWSATTCTGTSVQYGLVGAVTTAGIVVGSLLAGRIRRDAAAGRGGRRRRRRCRASRCCWPAWCRPCWCSCVVYSTLGVANGALNTSTGTLVFTRVPDAVRGRVGAALNGVSRACSIVALALGGLAGVGARGGAVVRASRARWRSSSSAGWRCACCRVRDVAPPASPRRSPPSPPSVRRWVRRTGRDHGRPAAPIPAPIARPPPVAARSAPFHHAAFTSMAGSALGDRLTCRTWRTSDPATTRPG